MHRLLFTRLVPTMEKEAAVGVETKLSAVVTVGIFLVILVVIGTVLYIKD